MGSAETEKLSLLISPRLAEPARGPIGACEQGEYDMRRKAYQSAFVLAALLAVVTPLTIAGCSATREATQGKAVLDFSRPPNEFYPARLVVLDGKNVNAPISKTSFWIEPGTHEIVVAAGINSNVTVKTAPNRSGGPDPGLMVVEVEAGKRYNIGAQLINERGDWEPVIWRIR